MSTTEWIGLDIGASEIKAALVRDGLPIAAVSQELAVGVIERGRLERPEDLTRALKRLWSAAQLPSREVAFTLSGRTVALRLLELPDPGQEHLEQAVRLNAGPMLAPLDPATTIVGFRELSREGVSVQVAVAAARDDLVASYQRAIEKAGLRVIGADLTPVVRGAALDLSLLDPTKVALLIDVGAEVTTVSALSRRGTEFVRVLNLAGNDFTRALGIEDWSEAQRLKAQCGLTTPPTSRVPEQEVILRQQQMRPVADQLIQEIAETLAFYRSLDERRELGQIIVSGGGSRLHGLPELIAAYVAPGLLSSGYPRGALANCPDFERFACALSLAEKARFSLPVASKRAGHSSRVPRVVRRKETSIPTPYLVAMLCALGGVLAIIWIGGSVSSSKSDKEAELAERKATVSLTRTPEGSHLAIARYNQISQRIAQRKPYATAIQQLEASQAKYPQLTITRLLAQNGSVQADLSGNSVQVEKLLSDLKARGVSARSATGERGNRAIVITVDS